MGLSDKIRTDLKRLVRQGNRLAKDFSARGPKDSKFNAKYQAWYTEACRAIVSLLPERIDEFKKYYECVPNGMSRDPRNFCIKDWLVGHRTPRMLPQRRTVSFHIKGDPPPVQDTPRPEKAFDDSRVIKGIFTQQVEILKSVLGRFESSLFEIRGLIQADLFDSELDAARELLENGFIRAAGAIAGVILEKHLRQVCENHAIEVVGLKSSINGFNTLLYKCNVYDKLICRRIQSLADVRNLCDHADDREPLPEEVQGLIGGVGGIIKEIM